MTLENEMFKNKFLVLYNTAKFFVIFFLPYGLNISFLKKGIIYKLSAASSPPLL